MKFLEISVLFFFALWLLTAAWVALSNNSRFQRLRKFLWFNGWFSQWTMFMPNVDGKIESFTISYRDQTKDGQIGPWQNIALEKPWSPSHFLVDPNNRLYGFMIKAVRSFGHLHDRGRNPSEAALFNFFHSVILSYRHNEQAQKRQVKVERSKEDDELILVQSDFLRLP
jgi:hypothetical protein